MAFLTGCFVNACIGPQLRGGVIVLHSHCAHVDITIMFTIYYVNNTIWTPTLRDDFSCYPLRMCPTEGTTRYDRASRSVIRLRFHTSLDQKRFLLHARKEKPNCHRDKNGREVQVGLVTQLVVELNLLETGRNTLSRSLIRVRGRTHAQIYSKHETPLLG